MKTRRPSPLTTTNESAWANRATWRFHLQYGFAFDIPSYVRMGGGDIHISAHALMRDAWDAMSSGLYHEPRTYLTGALLSQVDWSDIINHYTETDK